MNEMNSSPSNPGNPTQGQYSSGTPFGQPSQPSFGQPSFGQPESSSSGTFGQTGQFGQQNQPGQPNPSQPYFGQPDQPIQPAGYPPYGYQQPNANPPGATMAIVGFILSIVASLVGLIISIVALVQLNRAGATKNRGFAIAGIIIGAILTIISTIWTISMIGIFIAALEYSGNPTWDESGPFPTEEFEYFDDNEDGEDPTAAGEYGPVPMLDTAMLLGNAYAA